MSLQLYPKIIPKRQSYKGEKKVAVPSQSMTLKEILHRFVRRERLPVEHEGVYSERLGDLEKLQHEDISVRMERAAELKNNIATAQKRMKDAHDAKVKAEIERQAEEARKTLEAAATPPPPKTT